MEGLYLTDSGSFSNTERFLEKMRAMRFRSIVEPAVQAGVSALAAATPRDDGSTASAWGYEIKESRGFLHIYWTNDDINEGFSIAMGLQMGHGTGTGGYVAGRDYINPAMRPIFDRIVDDVWRAVTSA